MNLQRLNFRDEAVQRFFWHYLNPMDFRWDYTILDAMKEVERGVAHEGTEIWGDLSKHLVFRVDQLNPAVAQPHIMGNGLYIRDGLRHGLPILWKAGFLAVQIWTEHEKIARICSAFGFKTVGVVPHMYMARDNSVHPVYILNLNRADHFDGDSHGQEEET